MSKKKAGLLGLMIICLVVLDVALLTHRSPLSQKVLLQLELEADQAQTVQV